MVSVDPEAIRLLEPMKPHEEDVAREHKFWLEGDERRSRDPTHEYEDEPKYTWDHVLDRIVEGEPMQNKVDRLLDAATLTAPLRRPSHGSKSYLHSLPANTKPGLTPFKVPTFASPMIFIPSYLEVSFLTCSFVYVRHPTARPSYSEIPTPFPAELIRAAWEWYASRRPRVTSNKKLSKMPEDRAWMGRDNVKAQRARLALNQKVRKTILSVASADKKAKASAWKAVKKEDRTGKKFGLSAKVMQSRSNAAKPRVQGKPSSDKPAPRISESLDGIRTRLDSHSSPTL